MLGLLHEAYGRDVDSVIMIALAAAVAITALVLVGRMLFTRDAALRNARTSS